MRRLLNGGLLLASLVSCSRAAVGATPLPSLSPLSTTFFRFLGGSSSSEDSFSLLEEKDVYSGKYRQVKQRKVAFPCGKVVSYDIMTQGGEGSVLVFCFDTKTKTATLVREYHPGIGKQLLGTINGMFEKKSGKHQSALECAKMELEEEAQLKSDTWLPLLKEGCSSSEGKYSDNHFTPFLCLDPIAVQNAKAMDEDEHIAIERGLSYQQLMDKILVGDINVASSYTILLAFRKLESLGIVYL